jgi:hypothetical protein
MSHPTERTTNNKSLEISIIDAADDRRDTKTTSRK